jgi:excisionase family DNA binding protein
MLIRVSSDSIAAHLNSIIISLLKILELVEFDSPVPLANHSKQNKSASSNDSLALSRNYSVRETAAYLGVSERLIWNMIHKREIAHVRIGRRVLIPLSSIKEYVQHNTVPTFDPKKVVQELLRGNRK